MLCNPVLTFDHLTLFRYFINHLSLGELLRTQTFPYLLRFEASQPDKIFASSSTHFILRIGKSSLGLFDICSLLAKEAQLIRLNPCAGLTSFLPLKNNALYLIDRSILLQTSLQYHLHTSLAMDESTFPVTPNAVAVPILALVTLILDAAPFAWHIRNRNLAASSLVFWAIICNLMNFINPLVWPTDDLQHWWHGHIFCDIEIKLMMAANFGVVGSMACIMRNLAKALDTEQTHLSLSKAHRRRQTFIDCLLCFGGSVYVMLIHYIVQPNRYYIFAISGCTSSFDNSWPKLVLVFIWPPIICLVDAYYSGMYILRSMVCFSS